MCEIPSHQLMVDRYAHQNALITLFYRWLQDRSAWVLPVLYLLLRDLRDLAEQVSTVMKHSAED